MEPSDSQSSPHKLYRRSVLVAHLIAVGLLLAVASQGNGRGGLIAVFIIGYPFIFLLNLILSVVYGIRKNKTLMRFHVLMLIILFLFSLPLFMVVMIAVGGFC